MKLIKRRMYFLLSEQRKADVYKRQSIHILDGLSVEISLYLTMQLKKDLCLSLERSVQRWKELRLDMRHT